MVPGQIVAKILRLPRPSDREAGAITLGLRWSYGSAFGIAHVLLRNMIREPYASMVFGTALMTVTSVGFRCSAAPRRRGNGHWTCRSAPAAATPSYILTASASTTSYADSDDPTPVRRTLRPLSGRPHGGHRRHCDQRRGPSITEQLRPDYNQILWIGDIYSFVIAGLLITMGNLGDRIGRKRLLLISSLAFGAASVAAAWPHRRHADPRPGGAGHGRRRVDALDAGTAAQHVHRRPAAHAGGGHLGASGAGGAAQGRRSPGSCSSISAGAPVLLVNLPVVALIVGLGAWALPEARSKASHPLDPLSVVYSTAGILGVVYGITELAHSGLGVRNAYGALVAGAGLLWVFLRRQGRLRTRCWT